MLNGSSVGGGNFANTGGGIYNDGGTVTLQADSSVSDNNASEGGGI